MPPEPVLPPVLSQAHRWVERALSPGDLAIDATVGNGRDTAFLADRVGPTGLVIGFDVQQSALAAASARLVELGLSDRVRLVRSGHERMAEIASGLAPGRRPKTVVFNLGYRPGGDRAIITRPETTLQALGAALDLTLPGGVVAVVCYPGHEGGAVERDAVLDWARTIPTTRAAVVVHQVWNARLAPCLVGISPHETKPRP